MKPLNPIMAVLVIASVGASPLRTLAADGDKPTGTAVAVENTNSINALSTILSQNSEARKDAGKRIADFLLNADASGKRFVAIDVDAKASGDVAREWGEKTATVGSVAMLYFVAGPGVATPGWALKDPILSKTFAPGGKWEPRLRIALADWTGKNQITKARAKSQVTAFLSDAADKAGTVFADTRDTAEIDQSINQNNTTATKFPDLTRTAGSQFGATQYTLDDLYVTGAVVTDVSGGKDANSRRISMKIFSRRDEKGDIVNEIGIFDITDSPRDVFGQRFAIGGGDQSFALDDRTAGHKKYDLKFGKDPVTGETTVSFSRPGDGGAALKTKLNDLFTLRADQAAEMQNIVKIEGQEFYTLPQGGAKSGLMLFPKSVIDARRKGRDPMDLGPSLYSEVGERASDGRNQNVKPGPNGGPMLGKVGGTDYKLVFNNQLGVWEVAKGIGDLPPVPKPAGDGVAGSTTTAGGGATAGGGTPTVPGTGDPNQAEMAIPDIENILLKNETCRKDQKDTELMADSLKGKYGMIMCNPSGKAGGDQAILLVPKSVWANQQMVYSSIRADDTVTPPSPAAVLKKGRIVDHYLVLVFDTQVQYLDLNKQIKGGFELVGLVASKDAGGPPTNDPTKDRPGMTNMIIFLDALRNYMDIPAGSPVFAAVPERVKKELGDKPFDLQARYSKENILQVFAKGDGPHFQVWPTVKYPPSGTPNTQYEKLGGPANVFEQEVSSMNAPFEPKIDVSNSFQLVREGAPKKGEDIALYKYTDPTGKDKTEKYYVSFKYKGLDTKTADPASPKVEKIFKQKYFEAFNSDNPLPEKRAMQGLTDTNTAQVRGLLAYRFIKGTTPKKGVLAVFQNAQLEGEGQKDGKANCVGPIVWWGVADRDAALKVCNEDKF